jgi:hypothetical protein
MRASSEQEIHHIASVVGNRPFRTYIEVPIASDPGMLIDAIASHRLNAQVRTGGVTATASPRSGDIVRFLCHCVRAYVPFKAAAGLHHPLRGAYPLTYDAASATAVMFGYLNVFLAAALLYGGASVHDAIGMLEERDAGSIQMDDDGVRWRGRFMPASDIAALREHALAGFGSCSFTEPVDEIIALGFA